MIGRLDKLYLYYLINWKSSKGRSSTDMQCVKLLYIQIYIYEEDLMKSVDVGLGQQHQPSGQRYPAREHISDGGSSTKILGQDTK